jgi:hypothetical protein
MSNQTTILDRLLNNFLCAVATLSIIWLGAAIVVAMVM